MNSPATIPLRDRLLAAAGAWTASTGRSSGALSARVMDDGKTLDRLAEDPGRAVYDTTISKFAKFLVDPENWPEGEVADEAKALAHVVGVSAPAPALSAGQTDNASSAQEKAA
ncbi:hypothetical protein [Qipengyuania huizhouensis]|uniref:hypothetical protein n=1 Tax=Qipengyuania huizhouensis TaxID=2867245 RepID=UPI001C87A71B|nr:hypothetical protein [Qipengyuania huizhouensis]MBX7459530.1 hypothetical protein [Qipengyuania huizhouensis]